MMVFVINEVPFLLEKHPHLNDVDVGKNYLLTTIVL